MLDIARLNDDVLLEIASHLDNRDLYNLSQSFSAAFQLSFRTVYWGDTVVPAHLDRIASWSDYTGEELRKASAKSAALRRSWRMDEISSKPSITIHDPPTEGGSRLLFGTQWMLTHQRRDEIDDSEALFGYLLCFDLKTAERVGRFCGRLPLLSFHSCVSRTTAPNDVLVALTVSTRDKRFSYDIMRLSFTQEEKKIKMEASISFANPLYWSHKTAFTSNFDVIVAHCRIENTISIQDVKTLQIVHWICGYSRKMFPMRILGPWLFLPWANFDLNAIRVADVFSRPNEGSPNLSSWILNVFPSNEKQVPTNQRFGLVFVNPQEDEDDFLLTVRNGLQVYSCGIRVESVPGTCAADITLTIPHSLIVINSDDSPNRHLAFTRGVFHWLDEDNLTLRCHTAGLDPPQHLRKIKFVHGEPTTSQTRGRLLRYDDPVFHEQAGVISSLSHWVKESASSEFGEEDERHVQLDIFWFI